MKIDKKIERRNLRFYIIGYIIFGIILILAIALITSLLMFLGNRYQGALQKCVDKGYSSSYCKSLLN
jgi:hypothetical protein